MRTFIREWLHLDKVATIDKSDPRFAELRQPLLDEANDFIDEVTLNDDGTLAKLLTAGYTVVGPPLAVFYGVSTAANGRASLAGTARVGLLQQGGRSCSQFCREHLLLQSSDGAVFLDRITCLPSPPPSLSGIVVKQPKPDPRSTTRELFAAHSADPCASGVTRA